MSTYGDDDGEVRDAIQDEVSFVSISCPNSCSICGKPSAVYLHPLDDGTPCVACFGCSGNLVAEGTHREYPFEVSATNNVNKQLVDNPEGLLLVVVDSDGVPSEESRIRMSRANTIVMACQS